MSKHKSIVALPMPSELHAEIRRAAKDTHLSQADVMRQSMRLGLPRFVEAYPQPKAKALVKSSK